MTPAKPGRRNAPRRRYPELPLDHTAFPLEAPFRHSPEHRRTPASCELAAEQVTNAASASRTSSADTFLAGWEAQLLYQGHGRGRGDRFHRRRCRAARSSVWLEVPGMNWWIKFRIVCSLRAWLEGRPAVGLLRSARGRFPSMAEGVACYRVPRLSRPL